MGLPPFKENAWSVATKDEIEALGGPKKGTSTELPDNVDEPIINLSEDDFLLVEPSPYDLDQRGEAAFERGVGGGSGPVDHPNRETTDPGFVIAYGSPEVERLVKQTTPKVLRKVLSSSRSGSHLAPDETGELPINGMGTPPDQGRHTPDPEEAFRSPWAESTTDVKLRPMTSEQANVSSADAAILKGKKSRRTPSDTYVTVTDGGQIRVSEVPKDFNPKEDSVWEAELLRTLDPPIVAEEGASPVHESDVPTLDELPLAPSDDLPPEIAAGLALDTVRPGPGRMPELATPPGGLASTPSRLDPGRIEELKRVVRGALGCAHADREGNVLGATEAFDAEIVCATTSLAAAQLEELTEPIGLGPIRSWCAVTDGTSLHVVHTDDALVVALGPPSKTPEGALDKFSRAVEDD